LGLYFGQHPWREDGSRFLGTAAAAYDDVELAQVPLHAFVLDGATAWAAQPALIDGATGSVLSYRDLAESARKAAAGLVAHGLTNVDVLALCSPNCPEFVVAYFAALAAGSHPGPRCSWRSIAQMLLACAALPRSAAHQGPAPQPTSPTRPAPGPHPHPWPAATPRSARPAARTPGKRLLDIVHAQSAEQRSRMPRRRDQSGQMNMFIATRSTRC
jgi:hypothetical protein